MRKDEEVGGKVGNGKERREPLWELPFGCVLVVVFASATSTLLALGRGLCQLQPVIMPDYDNATVLRPCCVRRLLILSWGKDALGLRLGNNLAVEDMGPSWHGAALAEMAGSLVSVFVAALGGVVVVAGRTGGGRPGLACVALLASVFGAALGLLLLGSCPLWGWLGADWEADRILCARLASHCLVERWDLSDWERSAGLVPVVGLLCLNVAIHAARLRPRLRASTPPSPLGPQEEEEGHSLADEHLRSQNDPVLSKVILKVRSSQPTQKTPSDQKDSELKSLPDDDLKDKPFLNQPPSVQEVQTSQMASPSARVSRSVFI